MAAVKIFTKSSCPYCTRVKEFFKSKGVEFEEVDLQNKPDELAALKEKTGLRTVPQVFIGDKLIGGCDDTLALDQRGELDSLLAG